jgi:hypothetical protein
MKCPRSYIEMMKRINSSTSDELLAGERVFNEAEHLTMEERKF